MDAMLPQEVYGTHPRRFFALSVTGRCNYLCRHCGSGRRGARAHELPFGDYVKFIRSAWTENPDFHVQITGGEPLLRLDDTLTIIRLLENDGIYTHLSTNGSLIDDDVVDALLAARLSSVAISIDGFGHQHDLLRGVPGAFAAAVRALERLGRAAHRIRVSVATVLFDHNLDDVEEFIRDILQHPFVSHINFQAVFPELDERPGPEFYGKSELWPRRYGRAVSALDRIAAMKRAGWRVKNPLAQIEAMKAYFTDPLELFRGECNAEQEILHIAPNGDVRLCTYREPIANIQETFYGALARSAAWRAAVDELRGCRVNCHAMVNCAFSDS